MNTNIAYKRNKYHSFIIWLYNQKREGLLPENFRNQIPHSTASTWRSINFDNFIGNEFAKLNEEALRSIASAGRGTYTQLRNSDEAADKIMNEIAGMDQKSLGAVMFTDYTSYFQYFLLLGFVLLLIEWLIKGTNMKMKTT
jgi:hypothetical protein